MNVIENDVRALVDKELTAANERFPQFRSQHEGYAVILEEFDEAKEQLEAAELFFGPYVGQRQARQPSETVGRKYDDVFHQRRL